MAMSIANIIQVMSIANIIQVMSIANNTNSKGPPQIQEEHII